MKFISENSPAVSSKLFYSVIGVINSGQPEKFSPPPPLKFFPVFVDFFCVI